MATRDCAFLETAIDDVVSACVRFKSVGIIVCALQINDVKIETDTGFCADQFANLDGDKLSNIDIEYLGNLDWIKYRHNLKHLSRPHYVKWASPICDLVAYFGHLDVLQWAVKNNYLWDENTCISALRSGKLDVLQWAIENGCSYEVSDITILANIGGYKNIVDWIMQIKYSYDTPTHTAS